MSSLPPRHLCIAGALCIAFGVGSVTEMIAELIGGHVSIDFGFLGLPIGYGILIGRASSRKWALFFAIAGLVFAAACVGWLGYDHWTGGGRMTQYPDSVSGIVAWVLLVVSSFYIRRALTRSGHEEWFAAEKQETSAAKSLTWAVVAVAAFLHVSQQTANFWMHKTLEQVYPFHVRVAPYNAENGQGLTSIAFSSDSINRASESKTKLPKVSRESTYGQDGIQCEFDGIATQAFQITLHSENFEDKTITLDRESEKVIRVPMKPLAAGKEKPDGGAAPADPPAPK